MLSFFPNPYPDELLYSLISRYHIRSGNTSPKITLQEIFNSQTTIATADLPYNLGKLIENIKFISNNRVDELICKHTIFPFYNPFIPPNIAKQVIEVDEVRKWSKDSHNNWDYGKFY